MAEITPDLVMKRSSFRTCTGWTIFFMVLLRVAIGWHFVYEGAWKLMEDDWRATGYLTQSIGPLRPLFLWMVEDPEGLQRLTPESVKDRIDGRYKLLIDHYQLTEEQRKETDSYVERKKVGDSSKPEDQVYVDAIFADPDFQHQLADYELMLTEIGAQEKEVNDHMLKVPEGGLEYNRERLMYNYSKKARARQALLARAEAPLKAVEANTMSKLTPGQLALGPPPKEKSQTFFIDWANMLALTAVGVCLMLGLFTRLAALGGVGLLLMYYFAMPPWPGLPETPMAEGHYLIVNKNLIEALALLAIATSGIGRWGGLDAFIGSRRRRATLRAAMAAEDARAAEAAQAAERLRTGA